VSITFQAVKRILSFVFPMVCFLVRLITEQPPERYLVEFLKVKDWNQFQHYAKRNPPWIKLHRLYLDDYEFCSLPDTSKAHLMLLWLFASQHDGRIPRDAKFLEIKLSCNEINLDILIEKGFLVSASNVLASR